MATDVRINPPSIITVEAIAPDVYAVTIDAPPAIVVEAGLTGQPGPQGDAATIAVGTVTTVDPADPATVTNVGTSSVAIFDFEIPKGDTGDTGPQGPTGSTGSPGAAATIAVGAVTTGAPGSSATVTNVGSSSVAVFDFAIPRGDVGATGPTGATGATGAGVPVGGTAGQVLAKIDGTDYNTQWVTGGGGGGSSPRTATVAMTFTNEGNECTTVVADATVTALTVIWFTALSEDLGLQGVTFQATPSVGVGYTVTGYAPNGATGTYNITAILQET